jgi:hypothetical protein
MTAYVLDLRRDRLTIGSDTCAYVVAEAVRPLGFTSKVTPIPHLRAALCGRGILAIGYEAAMTLNLSAELQTFSQAAAALPDILRRVTSRYAAHVGIGDHRDTQIFEAIFCGWDAEQQRMRLLTFYNYQGDDGYGNGEDFPPGAYGAVVMPVLPPDFALPPEAAKLSTTLRIRAGMEAARRYFLDNGAAIVGGELVTTEITPQGITQQIIGQFEDFAQTRVAAGAVAARYLRGDATADVRDGLAAADDLQTAGHDTRQRRRAAARAARKSAA